MEKENLDPKKFLDEAWQLIEKAREKVLRAQTDEEYLVAHGGSRDAAEKVIGHILQQSRVPFQKLCDPNRNEGDTEMIHGVQWKVHVGTRVC